MEGAFEVMSNRLHYLSEHLPVPPLLQPGAAVLQPFLSSGRVRGVDSQNPLAHEMKPLVQKVDILLIVATEPLHEAILRFQRDKVVEVLMIPVEKKSRVLPRGEIVETMVRVRESRKEGKARVACDQQRVLFGERRPLRKESRLQLLEIEFAVNVAGDEKLYFAPPLSSCRSIHSVFKMRPAGRSG